MDETTFQQTHLIGISLPHKTSNQGGQSGKDCGMLWQKFEDQDVASKIPSKKSHAVYAVYHNYEGDHTQPFSYFIGCPVEDDASVPQGLDVLTLPGGFFQKFVAKGKIPDSIAATWRQIWESTVPRAYTADFEVYDERASDWSDGKVDIFISVKPQKNAEEN